MIRYHEASSAMIIISHSGLDQFSFPDKHDRAVRVAVTVFFSQTEFPSNALLLRFALEFTELKRNSGNVWVLAWLPFTGLQHESHAIISHRDLNEFHISHWISWRFAESGRAVVCLFSPFFTSPPLFYSLTVGVCVFVRVFVWVVAPVIPSIRCLFRVTLSETQIRWSNR